MKEQNCRGCEFYDICAGTIMGILGNEDQQTFASLGGEEKKEWCRNWQKFHKQRKMSLKKKEEKSKKLR